MGLYFPYIFILIACNPYVLYYVNMIYLIIDGFFAIKHKNTAKYCIT